jgi:hypothetical protein
MPRDTTKEQRPKRRTNAARMRAGREEKKQKKSSKKEQKLFFLHRAVCLFTSISPQFRLHDDRKPVARRCGVVNEWSLPLDLTMEEDDQETGPHKIEEEFPPLWFLLRLSDPHSRSLAFHLQVPSSRCLVCVSPAPMAT